MTILALHLAAAISLAAQSGASAAPEAPATPQPAIVINGQMVDIERGYIVFASGDAFKLSATPEIVDDATGAAPAYAVTPGLYAAATLDPMTALVTSVRLSPRAMLGGTPASLVPRQYVAAVSPQQPNPDLAPPAVSYTSKLSPDVLVTIGVEVPPETPYTDDIYVTTDSSDWNAQAIKMQRIDGRHFRIQIHLKGGSEFHYLFTRGSWQSVERDRSGLQRSPRFLAVPGGDSMVLSLTVFRWADVQ
jgi:hypothetical protein